MINNINLSNVRGINNTFTFTGGSNKIIGGNGVGKSTIINGIKDIYRGRTKSIKDGIFQLITSDGEMLEITNGILMNKQFGIGDVIDIITPGFFMNEKRLVGINKSLEDQRSFLSEVIGIDRFQFFLDNEVSYDIKGLTSELKTINTKEKTYGSELIEEMNKLTTLEKVTKPRKVELIEGNKSELDNLTIEYSLLSDKSEIIIDLPIKPEPLELIQDKEIQGNESELIKLKEELQSIVEQGKNTQEKCNCCGQDILDSEKVKASLRGKYTIKQEEINNFKLIETKVIKGNIEEWKKNQEQINEFNRIQKENLKASDFNLKNKIKLDKLQKQIDGFNIVEGNIDKYQEYQNRLTEYNEYNLRKKLIEDKIEDLKSKIKGLNSKDIEIKIEKYKEVENLFIHHIGDKLQGLGELDIMFYKELKTPNSDGDRFKPTFEVKYKGIDYNELSGGERVIVDIILSSLFIRHYKKQSIDMGFILIDQAEISDYNLNKTITEYLGDIQVIYTRIGEGELKVVTS